MFSDVAARRAQSRTDAAEKQHTASRRSPESLEHSRLNGTKQGCAPLERVSFRVFKQGFPRSPGEDTDRGALRLTCTTDQNPSFCPAAFRHRARSARLAPAPRKTTVSGGKSQI